MNSGNGRRSSEFIEQKFALELELASIQLSVAIGVQGVDTSVTPKVFRPRTVELFASTGH